MRPRIVIVGDIAVRPNRRALLDALNARDATVEWDWIQPENAQFGLPHKYFMRLQNQLRARVEDQIITIVKLPLLHGKDANTLYQVYPDPVQSPWELETVDALAEWLCSPAAGIVPQTTWLLPVREVALFCLLAKLLKNKSFNKDTQGHMWTKESDFLKQSPVNRPHFQDVYGEAVNCLDHAVGNVLLTKGGKQGTTRKEWCINTAYLPVVKQAATRRSLQPFRADPRLTALMEFIDRGPGDLLVLDGDVVSEKVLAVCRNRD